MSTFARTTAVTRLDFQSTGKQNPFVFLETTLRGLANNIELTQEPDYAVQVYEEMISSYIEINKAASEVAGRFQTLEFAGDSTAHYNQRLMDLNRVTAVANTLFNWLFHKSSAGRAIGQEDTELTTNWCLGMLLAMANLRHHIELMTAEYEALELRGEVIFSSLQSGIFHACDGFMDTAGHYKSH